jgi:hypothetical protein
LANSWSPHDADVYLGAAASCFTRGAGDVLCSTQVTYPVGTTVEIGSRFSGELVYSSAVAMRAAGGHDDPDACVNNDFALVKIDREDHGYDNPTLTVLHAGGAYPCGPVGLGRSGLGPAQIGHTAVWSQGWLPEVPGSVQGLQATGDDWSLPLQLSERPSDDFWGGPLMSCSGEAVGVLSPQPLAADVDVPRDQDWTQDHRLPARMWPEPSELVVATNLSKALDYMRESDRSFKGVELVPGTEDMPPSFECAAVSGV